MTPDYQTAAIKAIETLIRNNITATPVDPLPILKKTPGVLVLSYETMSNDVGMDRRCVISTMGNDNQAAFTSVNVADGRKQYLVTYNQKLPFYVIQRALARELGHIVLGHDGTKPESVRDDEAKCFANHLLMPRPLLHLVQATNIRLTLETLNNLTGCNGYCLSCMRKLPAISVPAELNRLVSDQFRDSFLNFFNFQRIAARNDASALADLGTYMDGYAE